MHTTSYCTHCTIQPAPRCPRNPVQALQNSASARQSPYIQTQNLAPPPIYIHSNRAQADGTRGKYHTVPIWANTCTVDRLGSSIQRISHTYATKPATTAQSFLHISGNRGLLLCRQKHTGLLLCPKFLHGLLLCPQLAGPPEYKKPISRRQHSYFTRAMRRRELATSRSDGKV